MVDWVQTSANYLTNMRLKFDLNSFTNYNLHIRISYFNMYSNEFLKLAKEFNLDYFILGKTSKFAKGCPCTKDRRYHGFIHHVITNEGQKMKLPLCITCIKNRTNSNEFQEWILKKQKLFTVRGFNTNKIVREIIALKIASDGNIDSDFRLEHIAPVIQKLVTFLENIKKRKDKKGEYMYNNILITRNAYENLIFSLRTICDTNDKDYTNNYSRNDYIDIGNVIQRIFSKYLFNLKEYGNPWFGDYFYKFVVKDILIDRCFEQILKCMKLIKDGKVANINWGDSQFIKKAYKNDINLLRKDINNGKFRE